MPLPERSGFGLNELLGSSVPDSHISAPLTDSHDILWSINLPSFVSTGIGDGLKCVLAKVQNQISGTGYNVNGGHGAANKMLRELCD